MQLTKHIVSASELTCLSKCKQAMLCGKKADKKDPRLRYNFDKK